MNETGNNLHIRAEAVPSGLTITGLIASYRTDPDSPLHKLRYSTKENYRSLMDRLDHDHGYELLSDLTGRILLRLHAGWAENPDGPPKIAMAHSLIGMLRTLVNFGCTILEDPECERLSGVLHKMRFEMGKPRTSALDAEGVTAIRKRANALGLHSIALAQAFQFEGTLRQKDCIGEWVPVSEKGVSDVLDDNGRKWLAGLRWEEIDANLILRHVTSKRQKQVEVDLKLAPMVLEELGGIRPRSQLPAAGPIIKCETMGRPWTAIGFRRMWRRIASEVGIPATVRNMDTRAGAITEALQSGAGLDAVRKAATHSNASMTQRYSRGDADDIADVMAKRAASRGAA